MRSAVEYYGVITPLIADSVASMRDLMTRVPDNGEELWSCHAVTRGFKAYLDLPFDIEEGFFGGKGVCHAWFVHREPGHDPVIVDVLPMGAHGGPIIAAGGRFAPWTPLYIENAAHYADQREKFAAEAALFVAALEKVTGETSARSLVASG